LSNHTAQNADRWRDAHVVGEFATREIRPVEALILLRYRDGLAGEMLELGSGAGRLTGYLIEVAAHVTGIDVSPDMVAYCREAYPAATFEERDLRDLGGYGDGAFSAVVAPFNVISILGHDERLALLDELARIVAPGGLLVFSAHNRAFMSRLHSPAWVVSRHPRLLAERLGHLPERMRNHRRLRAEQRDEPDYALVNDDALHYALLHYYISRDAQERQLSEHGFTLLECLDRDGVTVPPGGDAAHEVELHYVARRA
jgi:SAM-dependent methyltransferase